MIAQFQKDGLFVDYQELLFKENTRPSQSQAAAAKVTASLKRLKRTQPATAPPAPEGTGPFVFSASAAGVRMAIPADTHRYPQILTEIRDYTPRPIQRLSSFLLKVLPSPRAHSTPRMTLVHLFPRRQHLGYVCPERYPQIP